MDAAVNKDKRKKDISKKKKYEDNEK